MKSAIRFEECNSCDISLKFSKSRFDVDGRILINESQLLEFGELLEYLNRHDNLEFLLDQIEERLES